MGLNIVTHRKPQVGVSDLRELQDQEEERGQKVQLGWRGTAEFGDDCTGARSRKNREVRCLPADDLVRGDLRLECLELLQVDLQLHTRAFSHRVPPCTGTIGEDDTARNIVVV